MGNTLQSHSQRQWQIRYKLSFSHTHKGSRDRHTGEHRWLARKDRLGLHRMEKVRFRRFQKNKTFHLYYTRAEPLPLCRNFTTMIHVMYICRHLSRYGFMTSLKCWCNNKIKMKKKNPKTHTEWKWSKTTQKQNTRLFKYIFETFFLFFFYMSSSSCACRIMKLQRSFHRKANRPWVVALGEFLPRTGSV